MRKYPCDIRIHLTVPPFQKFLALDAIGLQITKMTHCVSIIYCQAKLSVSIIYLSDKTLCFNQIFVRQNSLFQSYISQTKLSVSIIYFSDKTLCFYHIFVSKTLCFYHIFVRQNSLFLSYICQTNSLFLSYIFQTNSLFQSYIFQTNSLFLSYIFLTNSLFQSYTCQTKLSVSIICLSDKTLCFFLANSDLS